MIEKILLAVIDVQERMMPVIDQSDLVVTNIRKMVQGCLALGIPMLVTEQYSKGLGSTVAPVAEALGEWYRPIEKSSFSAVTSMRFMQQLETTGAKRVLLCGVETHICVFQTARDLREVGWDVEIVSDAVGSRLDSNHRMALDRMARHGVEMTSVEMALFSIMKTAESPEFKTVSAIVKPLYSDIDSIPKP
jgi:nicotinamidase-related amidase